MLKRTMTIPISIETIDPENLAFNVYIEGTNHWVVEVRLEHPRISLFSAVVTHASHKEAVKFPAREFDDIDDAVHYFAEKYQD